MSRLKDKIAIVTGGGDGIGQATCRLFAEHGAKVAIFEIVEESGRATAAELQAKGADAFFVKVDVSQEADVVAGVEQVVKRWGGVDVLVNNAAITGANKLAHEVAVEDWDKVFAVNVRGGFLCTKHVVPWMMKARRGSIVNFSSIYGLVGNNDMPPYHATKGAIIAMTKTDAICYGQHGIRVNCVHPGTVKTALLMKNGALYPGGLEVYLDMLQKLHVVPIAEPVDIANCVLFLASDESSFVTGSSLVCDGGYTAQ